MEKYRKKPVVIEAVQFTGQNGAEIEAWSGGMAARPAPDAPLLEIRTLEGLMTAFPTDWIVRGVKGEFYPCKPDIFAATYEAVE
jgi:hypothetical protein